jgi:hypothetical protein
MPLRYSKHVPGKPDINQQFSPKAIMRTLNNYTQLGSNYSFGDLTAKHCNLTPDETKHWENELKLYPKDVQDEIKRTVINALTHKDNKGLPSPIPIAFEWSAPPKKGPKRGVRVTYYPSGPKYAVVILGYPGPMSLSLAQRRARAAGKKSKK